MINLFRRYSLANIAWLIAITILLRLGYILNAPQSLDFIFVEPFTRSLVPIAYENAFSPAFNILLAAVLVLGQALLLNFIVNYFNLLGRPSFLTALTYVLLASMFSPFLILSPPLICNFLLIWMVFKMLTLYKAENPKATAFDLGMIVAAGSLIYLPFIYFMLIVWAAFLFFRPFDIREWMASIFGYITIFFFLTVYYYLNNNLKTFYSIWVPLGTKFPNSIHITDYTYLLLIPVVMILFLSFTKIRAQYYKSYVQTRKSLQLLLLIFFVAGLSFYVKAEFRLNHFLLCVVPAAVFFGYYFLYAKWRWFYESLCLLLMAAIIYFQFNTF